MSDVPLRDYVDREVAHVKRLFSELRQADAERDALLRENIEHRLLVLNEFSERMKRLETTFATREQTQTLDRTIRETASALDKSQRERSGALENRIIDLENWRAQGVGRDSAWKTVFVLIATVAAVMSVVSVVVALLQGG